MATVPAKTYMKNLGKSILFSAKAVVSQQMPTLSDTYDRNKPVFQSGVSYTKDFLLKKGKLGDTTLKTPLNNLLKDIEELKKNAFDDLKTGKIVNFDRGMEKFAQEMGFSEIGINWDDDSVDLDIDVQESDSFKIINSVKASTKISEAGSNIRTKALMEVISTSSEKSTEYITKHNTRLQTISMNMFAQMHTDNIKLMTDTNTLLGGILEFQNKEVVDHMNKQLSFYDNVLQELREIKEFNSKSHKRQEQNAYNTEQVFGIGGSIDLAAYGKQIKKNFQNWASTTPIGMVTMLGGMVPGGLMGAVKESPMSFVMDLMMSGLMPKSFKDGLSKLDTSISGLFSALALKINSSKNKFDKPLQSALAQIFGVDIKSKSKIDVSGFHKDAMQYNGRADKALTEVIPTLLSNILSALVGSKKVALYDYSRGKFTHSSEVFKDYEGRISRSQMGEMDTIRTAMKRSLGGVRGGHSQTMTGELDAFMNFLISSDHFYNPMKDADVHALSRKGLNLKDSRSYNVLRAAFLSMPKHLQNKLSRDIINARTAGTRTTRNVEEELFSTGLSAAYSDLGGVVAPKANNKNISPISLLRDIKNILIDGIVVYGGGNVELTSTHLSNIMGRKSKNRNIIRGLGRINKVIRRNEDNTDLNDLYNMSFDDMKSNMSDANINIPGPPGRRSFLQDVIKEKSLVRKIQMIKNKISSPSGFLSGALDKMDSLIYRIIYGREDMGKDETGDPNKTSKKSLIGRLSLGITKAVDTSLNWIDTKIVTPMYEKFFGENGLFSKFSKTFEPFLTRMKEMSGRGFAKLSKFLVGEKNAFGFYTGGILADVGNSFTDFSNSIRHFFTGSSYMRADGSQVKTNEESSVFSYVKKYSKNMFESIKVGLFGEKVDIVDNDGNIIQKHKGDGILSGVINQLKNAFKVFDSLFKTKQGETPEDVDRTINQWKKELKGFLPKGIAGGLIGMGASLILPGGPLLGAFMGSTIAFASHSKKFRDFLFGNDEEGREGILPKAYINIAKSIKQHLPSITAGGILGLGASFILPGGPLLGLTLGSAMGFASKSQKVQEILFGKTDEKGNLISEGLLGHGFKKDLQKFFPSMAAGGLLGIGASFILPGGPLLGLTLGSAMGFASKSEKLQEILFGKTDEKGNLISKGLIDPKTKEKISKYLPKGIAGGIAGAISGGFGILMPGGPLVGAIIGSTLSVISSTDSFKNFLFGKIDPETLKRKGGALGQIRDFMNAELFEPFRKWRAAKKIAINEWFENAFKKPFLVALEPFKKSMGIIGERFKDSWKELKESFKSAFNQVFEKTVGMPLGELVKKHITDPMKNMLNRLFNAIGKGLSVILTSPIKFMTAFADTIIDKDLKERKRADKINTDTDIKDDTKTSKTSDNSLLGRFKSFFSSTIASFKSSVRGFSTNPEKSSIPYINIPTTSQDNNTLTSSVKNIVDNTSTDNSTPPSEKIKLSGDSKKRYGPFIGHIDLPKFYSKINNMEHYLRKIKDEVVGQLDGVGWNLDYISGVLGDVFGKPSIMPSEYGRRGNKRRRGLFGRILDIVKSPFRFVGDLTKNLIVKPIKSALNQFTFVLKSIARGIGGTVWKIAKIPFQLLNKVLKTISFVADSILTTFKTIGPAIGSLVRNAIEVVGATFKAGIGTLGQIFRGIGDIFLGLTSAVKDTIIGLGQITRRVIPSLIKGIMTLTETMAKATLNVGKFIVGLVSGGVKGIFSILKIPVPKFLKNSVQKVYVTGGTLDVIRTIERFGPAPPNMQSSSDSGSSDTPQGQSSSSGSGASKSGVINSLKNKVNNINNMLRSVTSNFKKSATQRLGFLSSIVKRSKNSADHEAISRGLQFEQTAAAVQSADAVVEMNKRSSILMKVWELFKLSLVPAIATIAKFIKNFKLPTITNVVEGLGFTGAKESVVRGIKSVGAKLGKTSLVAGAVVAGKMAYSKLSSKISSILTHPKIVAILGNNRIISTISNKVSNMTAKMITQSAGHMLGKIVARLNPFSAMGFMIYGITSGMAEVRNIFRIPPDSEPTWTMRFAAGVGKMLSLIVFGIISETTFAEAIYSIIGSDVDNNKLKDEQQNLQTELEVYNKENGTNLTIEQYSEQKNFTVWNKVKKGWNKTKEFASSVGSSIKTGYNWTKDNVISPAIQGGKWLFNEIVSPMFKGLYGIAKWGFNDVLIPIGKGIWNALSWGYTNIVKPFGKITMSILDGIGSVLKWGFTDIVIPVGEAIFDVLKWGFTEVVIPVGDAVFKVGEFIYDNGISPLVNIVSSGFGWAKDFFVGAFKTVSNILKSIANFFGGNDDPTDIPQPADQKGFATKAWEFIKSIFNKIVESAKGFGTNLAKNAKAFGERFGNLGNIDGSTDVGASLPGLTINSQPPPMPSEFGKGKGSISVPHISQQDPNVSNLKFGKTLDTIGDSGCAPAVAAMAVTAVTGKYVTITEMAKLASEKGFKNGYNGTNPAFFKYLESVYNIRVSEISGRDKNKSIIKALKNNKLVILLGGGPNQTIGKGTPFGSIPHYVLATGYNYQRNQIYINDPLSNLGNQIFELFATISNTNNAFVVESKSNIGIQSFKLDTSGKGKSFFGRGGSSDDDLRREYGYALSFGQSDMTVNDLRMIEKYSNQYGVNPHLWLNLVQLESAYKSKATTSGSDARGWGQIISSTGKEIYEKKLGLGKYNHDMAFNKELNAQMSIYYLSQHLKNYGSVEKALTRYNGGEIGDEYQRLISENLKNNTGLTFSDVLNASTNSKGSGNADRNVTGQSIAALVNILGTAATKEASAAYNIDLDDIVGAVGKLSEILDPFYVPDSKNAKDVKLNPKFAQIMNNNNYTEGQKIAKLTKLIDDEYPYFDGEVLVHDFIAKRMNALGMAYGKPVISSSGYRTRAEELQLVKDWERNHPGASVAERRKYVSDPGKGTHSLGLAVDAQGWVKSLNNEQLAKFKLYKPLDYEDWHIEPIETKSMIRNSEMTDKLASRYGTPFSPKSDIGGANADLYLGTDKTNSFIQGAPSATVYANRAIEANAALRGGSSSSHSIEMIRLLTIIAKGIENLVGISAETKESLDIYIRSLLKVASNKGGTTAIITQKETSIPGRSVNPLVDAGVKKRDKSKQITAIAAGIY